MTVHTLLFGVQSVLGLSNWNASRKSMISGWGLLSVLHDSLCNCSRVLSCQCYILNKNCCDMITGVSGHLLKWNQCVHYHHHKLHFLTTGLETISPDSLCDIPQYLQCHDHSPTCTMAHTSSSFPVQGVWTLINRTQTAVFMSDTLLQLTANASHGVCLNLFPSSNTIFQVFMAVVKMRVVFWVCTPCRVVPYVPSVSMRTTSDTEDGGSTSIQSVRRRKENASQCRTPKDYTCHSSNKFACTRPLSSINSKAQRNREVSSQPLTLAYPPPLERTLSTQWIGGLVSPRGS
jgi:hypothetical protein